MVMTFENVFLYTKVYADLARAVFCLKRVLYIVTLYRRYTRVMTFENVFLYTKVYADLARAVVSEVRNLKEKGNYFSKVPYIYFFL